MVTRYQFLAQAKRDFAFLATLGFRIESEYEGNYANFKDGFTLDYASKAVAFRVGYLDAELEVTFKMGKIEANYLFLDHNLRANASGLAGLMFQLDALAPVISAVARDIEANYLDVLSGEAKIWEKITKLVTAPREKRPRLP